MNKRDIIAAISTNSAEAAIGIVRMSGAGSAELFQKVFRSKKTVSDRMMIYGHIVHPDSGDVIDEVMAVFLSAPKTYTREDMVEIDCHGGSVAAYSILELLLAQGARLAEPGEFTLRAFLNGRIDLTQAESVVDLVKAKTPRAFHCALSQLEGATSAKVRALVTSLIELLAGITVSIDYPEEDVEDVSWNVIREGLDRSIQDIDAILKNSEHSRLMLQGAKIALIGRPNVGKSSLLNLLLGEMRAIVTDVPGTTRDTIEESLSIEGYPARIIDTAGIRATDDEVERIGVERAKLAANEADIILYLIDVSLPLDEQDLDMLRFLEGRNVLVVANKTDLCSTWNRKELEGFKCVAVSVLKDPDASLAEIRRELAMMLKRGVSSDDAIINLRHQQLLKEARQVLVEASGCREYDLVEVDLREAISILGKITGDHANAEILHTIFSKFCLGK